MAALSNETIQRLLEPYVTAQLPESLISPISEYLDLLIRWNARISLTAIRRPEEIIQRHFGESLFTAEKLASRLSPGAQILDYGSGPGFPGLPIQMLLPTMHVTVAESQARKVAFLREVIRNLKIPAEIWPKRVENMPADRRFDAVTLRAVEHMAVSLEAATARVSADGWIAALVGRELQVLSAEAEAFLMPRAEHRRLVIWQIVPRGTLG